MYTITNITVTIKDANTNDYQAIVVMGNGTKILLEGNMEMILRNIAHIHAEGSNLCDCPICS